MSLTRKRTAKPRAYKTPRCVIQRCSKPATVRSWCRKHAMDQADRLARQIVMQRDKVCRLVGTVEGHKCLGPLSWCHVHSRSYHTIRHDPRNAVIMCSRGHQGMTLHPLEWEQWCRDHGIAWDSLRLEALHGAASWSLDSTLERLMR